MTHDPQPRVSRRGFTGAVGAVGLAAAAVSSPAAGERAFAARPDGRPWRRPNILVILADDLGYGDLGCYGGHDIRTPHLDLLAGSGVRFTDGYSASAVCSPNRVALFTGRYQQRIPAGLPEPIRAGSPGIPPDHPTLATRLRDAGYETAMVGKWHGGFLPTYGPLKSGWDEFFGCYSGGIDYFSKVSSEGDYDLYDGERTVQDDRYVTDIITERAVDFVARDHDRPWLLNLNFTTPHWPWEGPGDRAVSDELTARVEAGDPRALFHYDGGSPDVYRTMVESLDTSIGQVLTALRRSGQLQDTLVLFASDNGGERFSHNWPLSGNKVDLYEGGIRVPTILSWPARIRERQVSHQPVHTLDWHATILELAGAEVEPDHPLDGTSLVDFLYVAGRSRTATCSGGWWDSGRCGGATSSTSGPRAPTTSTTWRPTSASRPTWPASGPTTSRRCGRRGRRSTPSCCPTPPDRTTVGAGRGGAPAGPPYGPGARVILLG